jgi:hypothetical protein
VAVQPLQGYIIAMYQTELKIGTKQLVQEHSAQQHQRLQVAQVLAERLVLI